MNEPAPMIGNHRIIAFCEKHSSVRLNIFVEPKPIQHKKVLQIAQCSGCIQDHKNELKVLQNKIREVFEETP